MKSRDIQARDLQYSQLSGRQKVAILMMSLDVDTAAKVFKELDARDVEQIAVEITNMRGIRSQVIDEVIDDFYHMMTAQEFIVEGGLDHALSLLEKSFGFEKAREIIDRIKMLTTVRGFDILKKSDPQQLSSFLAKEHPQTIALILSHLTPDQSAEVLNEFPEDLRADVLMRIATLGKVSPQLVSQVEQVVDQFAEQSLSQNLSRAGGAQLVASILNKSNNATAKALMENIEVKDPGLAIEIKRLMFLFDDIVMVDDKGIQRILREVDKKDLAMALKVSDEKIRVKIFKNMSERAAAVIREELEYMGPVRLKDVEQSQMRIVDIIKRLEESEEIVISGRGKEDVFV